MKTSDTAAVVLFVQSMLQIERGEVRVLDMNKSNKDLRHEACQRFRDHVRDEAEPAKYVVTIEPDYKTLYNTLAERVRELQRMVTYDPGLPIGYTGVDWNTVVHYINNTIAVKM